MAKRYHNRKKTIAWTVVGIAIGAIANVIDPDYQIRYNPSISAPRGFYLFAPTKDTRVGSKVFVQLPTAIAGFAAARNYLPLGVPILKRVGAIAGQHVCYREGAILIDGKVAARIRPVDGQGRPMPRWTECRILHQDEIFLLGSRSATSFDSRYFGPVSRGSVIARAVPLWTW